MSISDASEPTFLASQGYPSFLMNEPSFSNFRCNPTQSLKFVPYLGQKIAFLSLIFVTSLVLLFPWVKIKILPSPFLIVLN